MRINPEEITSVLKKEIETYSGEFQVEEEGTILEVGDGIARIYGLTNCMAGEMSNGSAGVAFTLEESSIGAVILGEYDDLSEGDSVKRTGSVLQVPVGEELIGRVVDPLGNPLDGKGPLKTEKFLAVESDAPGIADRQSVKEPLQTGIEWTAQASGRVEQSLSGGWDALPEPVQRLWLLNCILSIQYDEPGWISALEIPFEAGITKVDGQQVPVNLLGPDPARPDEMDMAVGYRLWRETSSSMEKAQAQEACSAMASLRRPLDDCTARRVLPRWC